MNQKSWLSEVDKPLESWSAKITAAVCGFARDQKVRLLRRPGTPEVMHDVRKKVKIFEDKLQQAYEIITSDKPHKRKHKPLQTQEVSSSRSNSPQVQNQKDPIPDQRLQSIRVLSEPKSQSNERPRFEYEPTPPKVSNLSREASQKKCGSDSQNPTHPSQQQNKHIQGPLAKDQEVKEEVESSDQNMKVFAELEPEGADILQCPACPKQFYQLESSLKHVIEHLPPQNSCAFCSQVFEDESDLVPHLISSHMPQDRLLQLKKINQFYFKVNPQATDQVQNTEEN